MREDQHRFLSVAGQLPARLTVDQAGWLLNCQVHDIPVLVAARVLKPLGNPAPNGTKYFATIDILEIMKDRSALAKITSTISQHWQRRNTRLKIHSVDGSQNGLTPPALAAKAA